MYADGILKKRFETCVGLAAVSNDSSSAEQTRGHIWNSLELEFRGAQEKHCCSRKRATEKNKWTNEERRQMGKQPVGKGSELK